ncbi:TerB family tellurite resistance protein [SAR86 cluster bacterium]|nr:TerB family tellurite resistance protein [SAR86 cluster bacterium]
MDKHEEHLIRRIADLLYLNHKDFINAKLNQKETNEDS